MKNTNHNVTTLQTQRLHKIILSASKSIARNLLPGKQSPISHCVSLALICWPANSKKDAFVWITVTKSLCGLASTLQLKSAWVCWVGDVKIKPEDTCERCTQARNPASRPPAARQPPDRNKESSFTWNRASRTQSCGPSMQFRSKHNCNFGIVTSCSLLLIRRFMFVERWFTL